jgi:asparagine synthase (glutamine-hydrolysing)
LIAGVWTPAGFHSGDLSDISRSYSDREDISFCRADADGFSGGGWFHRNLPDTQADRWYQNFEDDISVLATGTVYSSADQLNIEDPSTKRPLPELAARLFSKYGASFAEKLNGDFVIFIVKPSEGEAWLFHDNLGVEPCGWVWKDNRFIFHSDIIELSRLLGPATPPQPEYLLRFFKYSDLSLAPSPEVKILKPGHYLHITASGVREHKYWHPEKIRQNRKSDASEMLAELRELVEDAVRIRCDSRFTAATHLSSGIDSSVIGTLARKRYGGQKIFRGYSWSPESFNAGELKYDERLLAEKAAKNADIMPHFSRAGAADLISFLNSSWAIPWYFSEQLTMKKARADGVNLIFSGWGGDEFISIGDAGVDTDLLKNLALRRYFRRNPLFPIRRFAGYLVTYILRPALGILQPGDRRGFRDDAHYIKEKFRKSNKKVLKCHYSYRSRREFHLGMLGAGHLQERCGSWSVAGFLNGVRYRYPLLDRRIIEYMLSIPSETLCDAGDYRPVLRSAFRGVVEEEVLKNRYKTDPVYWSYYRTISREAASQLLPEISEWKKNSALSFIDFGLLEEDASRFREQTLAGEEELFFNALISIKAADSLSLKERG